MIETEERRIGKRREVCEVFGPGVLREVAGQEEKEGVED